VTQPRDYQSLIAQEARHWGQVQPDPNNPQLWHDPRLFEIFFGNEYRYFLDRIESAGAPVLELGCGEGHLAFQLAERGLSVTAIDLSPDRIERARQRASTSDAKVKPSFITGDLNTMRLPEGPYACVVAHDALHHLVNLGHVLDEVGRVLKPGGKLITLDYVGMGRWRKMVAAALYALLPTYQGYREKWKLRRRLRSFLASERQKRAALEKDDGAALHPESPFEEISQESISTELLKRFDVIQEFSFLPFWYYLAPKLKLSGEFRYRMASFMRSWDSGIVSLGLSRGAYVFIEARKR
jgi:ubiquinone/menaquinone biosynthesis C-methylase UbiE